jgi:two-component system, NtrC family, sensor histidine kinase HydH
MNHFRSRFLIWVILTSLCLLALSGIMAFSLISQQSAVNSVLRENVRSQRTAIELEDRLLDLIDLEDARVDQVAVLHNRVNLLLKQLDEVADQPMERALHDQVVAHFATYLALWRQLPPQADAKYEVKRSAVTRYLESEVLKPCQDFEHFNTLRVEQSAEQHERVLRKLVWGLGAVGLLGAISGVTFGFGIARGLKKSIRRLQVRVRDAAGKLGPDLPDIVVTEEGEFSELHAEMDLLTGRIEGMVRDLQDREHEVLRAEQLAAVGQLAAGVAHEIRNPLTSIKLLVQVGQTDPAGVNADDLRVIESEIRRMERSLNTFLEFARPPKLQRSEVAIGSLLADVQGLIRVRAERQNVLLKSELPAAPPVLQADPEQLRQVLLNLFLNALDAMPTGGEILAKVRPLNGWWEIEISDQGRGIAPEVLGRLFQPFSSTKETGLGLGLVISKRIIEDHGGTLNAANRVGGGASFYIRLPSGAAHANRVSD